VKSIVDRALNAWHASPRARRTATIAIVVVLVVQGYWSVFVRRSDFDWHYAVGQAFIAGDPYNCNSDHYPLGRTMFNAALATLPSRLAKIGMYLLAVGGLAYCIARWQTMAAGRAGTDRPLSAAAMAVALAILAPYMLRDLDECGLQLLLLFMLTAAALALWRGSVWRAGLWLAAAVTYKATPLLFLPLLLWKRQWRAAAAMVVFIVALNLAPAAWLGWDKMVSCNAQWLARARNAAATQDPALAPILNCPPEPRNFGLQVAFARYLQHCWYPPESFSPHNHPWYVHFGSLEPATAGVVTKGILLLMAAALAWRFWRPWTTAPVPDAASAQPGDRFATEWAVVTLLCALLSPFCWKQHLVLALPCLFLVVNDLFQREKLPRIRLAAVALIAVLVIFTKRFAWGHELSIVVASYKPDTIAMLVMLLLAVTIAQQDRGRRPTDASPRRTAKGAPHGPNHARRTLDPVSPAGVHAG
jgi:hypothetical protein